MKIYGLVGRPHYVLRFQDKKRYKLQAWTKTVGSTALLLRTLFKENDFKKSHLKGMTLKDFGLVSVGD